MYFNVCEMLSFVGPRSTKEEVPGEAPGHAFGKMLPDAAKEQKLFATKYPVITSVGRCVCCNDREVEVCNLD